MILCCGEALIDMIPHPTLAGPDGFVPHVGGSVFNTAIGLGRLGVPVGFLSGISTDLFGQQLVAALQASGVDTSCLLRSERLSTLAFVTMTNGQAGYKFFDENSAGRMLVPADLPALPDSVSTLYFGGISLCAEPAADTYAALAAREAGRRLIMLDPNIRPGFIPDEARYRARIEKMIALAQIVKVSDEDLNWLLPGPQSLDDKAAELQRMGPALVLVTRGKDGARVRLKGGAFLQAEAPPVKVVDTIGAGDTFNSGFLARAAELGCLSLDAFPSMTEEQVLEALQFAVRVAALTVSRAGADAPWRRELQ